ncbi:MAG: hypothetical protein PHQ27_08320 [Victivallales bacterium]|nr:hypothetical protein [Victivallales bacterium]
MYVPPNFIEISPGVFEKAEKGNPVSHETGAHYDIDALNILHSDFLHYRGLKTHLNTVMPELMLHYSRAVAVGGGSPKFEFTILEAREIEVLDGFAATYSRYDRNFRDIYHVDDHIKISYLEQALDHPFTVPAADRTCVTFIHFMEHAASWETICAWIAAQENDLVIYGPNIAAAHDQNWFHFRPVDHNIFFQIPAIVAVGERNGYHVTALPYSDDMLVWMRRPTAVAAGVSPEEQKLREAVAIAVAEFIAAYERIKPHLRCLARFHNAAGYRQALPVLRELQAVIAQLERFRLSIAGMLDPELERKLAAAVTAQEGLKNRVAMLHVAGKYESIASLLNHEWYVTIDNTEQLLRHLASPRSQPPETGLTGK